MKQLLYSLTLILSLILLSCGQSGTKSNFDIKTIDLGSVDFITIKKSGSSETKKLSENLTSKFVEQFNNAKPAGLIKFITLYTIEVRLKDGTKRNFRVNSQYFKENNDYSFDLKDPKFIEGIWNELNQSKTNM